MRALIRRLWYVFRRSDHDAELRDEIESHRAHRQDALERDGLAPTDAAWASRRAIGNVTLAIEDAADVWIVRVLDSVQHDIRNAVRGFRKRAGVSVVMIGTLALGIGANTAIFSVVNAVSLRPLPYRDSNRIYLVRRTGNAFGGPSISMPIFLGWQQAQHGVFEHLALVGWRNPTTVTGSGEADRIAAAAASTELFAVLGVRPALGRAFRPEEGRPGGPSVVIISDRLWRARFHGDSRVLGTTMTLDNDPSTIVGVLPADFALPVSGGDAADVWFPFRVPRTSSNPSNGGTLCLALLRADVSPVQAEALLTPPLAELRREFPNMFSAGERARLQRFRDFIAASAGPAPLLLFGAAVLVLLIACANVANLTMAASAVRQRELAVRAAIGAGRGRIVRQLLTESLLLALIGGVVGVALCYVGFDAIVALVPPTTPHVGDFSIDARVLFFALLLTIATGLLFGIMPAVGATGTGADAIVRRVNPSVGGRGRLRAVLAANEIAISVVLLIAAGLALQSFARLLRVEPGFDYSRALTFRVSIPPRQYATPVVRAAFFRDALDRLAALPGVERAALASVLPLQPGGDLLFSFEGPHPGSPDNRGAANFRFVSPQYFDALRIGLARGRVFSDADNASGKPVVLINRALARSAWADSDPIGEQIWLGKPMGPASAEPAPRQIVGVVDDIRDESLAEPAQPTVYVPYAQPYAQFSSVSSVAFIVRTTRAPLSMAGEVRAAIQALDPNVPLSAVRELQDVVGASTADWRFRAILLGLFAAVAVAIAAIGVYGVISYSVACRTQEIGVRVALGALRRDVLTLVLWQGLQTALWGIGVGLAAAYALANVMASMVYGVRATDPGTYVATAALLALVAAAASYVPARRAMRIDPMLALRQEA